MVERSSRSTNWTAWSTQRKQGSHGGVGRPVTRTSPTEVAIPQDAVYKRKDPDGRYEASIGHRRVCCFCETAVLMVYEFRSRRSTG